MREYSFLVYLRGKSHLYNRSVGLAKACVLSKNLFCYKEISFNIVYMCIVQTIFFLNLPHSIPGWIYTKFYKLHMMQLNIQTKYEITSLCAKIEKY